MTNNGKTLHHTLFIGCFKKIKLTLYLGFKDLFNNILFLGYVILLILILDLVLEVKVCNFKSKIFIVKMKHNGKLTSKQYKCDCFQSNTLDKVNKCQ